MLKPAAHLPLVVLLSACASAAEVDELEHVEIEVAERGFRTIPSADAAAITELDAPIERPEAEVPSERAAAGEPYVGPPRLRLAPRPASDADGERWCEDRVIADGFPALRDDGGTYVVVIHEIDAGADEGGRVVVQWRNVVGDAIVDSALPYDGHDTYELTERDPDRGCDRARARIARAIRPVNERLATGWRSLRALPVQLPAPPSWLHDPPPLSAKLSERPVDVLHRNGHFIARVRDVKVLQKLVKTDWLGLPPELTLDAQVPTIMGLYHDAATGFALAQLSYESGSCMSDPTIYTRPIALAPEVVAEADRRAAFVRSWPELEAELEASAELDEPPEE
jgi:hypothetical protein